MYDSLRELRRPLTRDDIIHLSEKPGFAAYWKLLANHLGFTLPQIERICADNGDDSERCYKLLGDWNGREYNEQTVPALAEAVYCLCQNATMLEIMHVVLL